MSWCWYTTMVQSRRQVWRRTVWFRMAMRRDRNEDATCCPISPAVLPMGVEGESGERERGEREKEKKMCALQFYHPFRPPTSAPYWPLHRTGGSALPSIRPAPIRDLPSAHKVAYPAVLCKLLRNCHACSWCFESIHFHLVKHIYSNILHLMATILQLASPAYRRFYTTQPYSMLL